VDSPLNFFLIIRLKLNGKHYLFQWGNEFELEDQIGVENKAKRRISI
jgi:hypothetical protein